MGPVARIAVTATTAATLLAVGGVAVWRTTPPDVPRPSRAAWVDAAGPAGVPSPDLRTLIERLEDRVRLFPSDVAALIALGGAYVDLARLSADPSLYAAAEDMFRRALAAGPAEEPDALIGIASIALARHGFAEALDLGRRARTIDPQDADALGVIGDAQIELGRYRAAFRTFQAMVDMRPDLSSYARVSYARELHGDVPGAIEAMRLAVRAAGTPATSAWTNLHLGQLTFDAGRVADAAAAYRTAARLAPGYVAPLVGRARVAWARGSDGRAIALFRQAIARYPDPALVAELVALYRTTGLEDLARRAETLFRAEVKLFRSHGVNTDLELALFESDHGDPARAVAAARAEWRRRRSIHVADALAWALARSGRYHAADRAMVRARSTGYRSALFLYHDAVIQLNLGDREAAEKLLRDALEVNPFFSILHAGRAETLLARLESR